MLLKFVETLLLSNFVECTFYLLIFVNRQRIMGFIYCGSLSLTIKNFIINFCKLDKALTHFVYASLVVFYHK